MPGLLLQAAETASIAVIYASAYGNTTALAQAISRGISKAGVGVESMNCELSGADEVRCLCVQEVLLGG
jgi:flavorubredoxin